MLSVGYCWPINIYSIDYNAGQNVGAQSAQFFSFFFYTTSYSLRIARARQQAKSTPTTWKEIIVKLLIAEKSRLSLQG